MIEHVQSAWTAAGDAVSADWARIVWAWGAAEFSVAWVLGAVGGLVGFLYAVLSHDGNYAVIRDLCRRDSPRRLWRRIVLIGLRRLSRWFGPSWSFKAFDRSIALAIVYPVVVILFAWAMGGPFRLGLEWIDDDLGATPAILRWSLAIGVPALIVASVNCFRFETAAFGTFIAACAIAAVAVAAAGDVVAIIAFHAFAAFVVGISGVAIVWGVACVTSFVVFAVLISVPGFVVTGGVPIGIVLSDDAFGAGGAFSEGGVGVAFVTVILPLYLIVPVLNGIFDFLSWFASRRLFLRLARRSPSTARLIVRTTWHLTLDLVLAMVFLGCLAVVLPACMALHSHALLALGAEVGFPWRDYLNAATDDPWGSGLAVTAMLITTLVPTLLHMSAVGFSLALPTIGHLWPDGRATPTPVDRLRYALSTTASIVTSLLLLIAVAVVIHAFIAAVFGGFGTTLAAMAEASGAWVESWFTQAP